MALFFRKAGLGLTNQTAQTIGFCKDAQVSFKGCLAKACGIEF